MREYQKRYIRNLECVAALVSGGMPYQEKTREHRAFVVENTGLLREHLMPVLDDIASVCEAEAQELSEFAEALTKEPQPLDLVLGCRIHDALISYARCRNLRDFLIQELYCTGRGLCMMQEKLRVVEDKSYDVQAGRLFEEAASYIGIYDEIADAKTRGYIHQAQVYRSFLWPEKTGIVDGGKKAQLIRSSMQILTDPFYREKTPELPWDRYLCESHWERMKLMTLFPEGREDSRFVREVLESTQYIWNCQQGSCKELRRRGARWNMEYERALYHCGIQSLTELLAHMEDVYMDRRMDDYSEEGVYVNVLHVGLYAQYLRLGAGLVQKKKEIVKYMYRMLANYVCHVPDDQVARVVAGSLMTTLKTYIEYPDGMSYKDFLIQLVVERSPQTGAFAREVAQMSASLMRGLLHNNPYDLVGLRNTVDVQEVCSRQEELVQFAYDSGMLHDVGAIPFLDLLWSTGRSWMLEEQRLYEYRAHTGYRILMQCDSTKDYAQTALGHSVFYNGVGGYPADYQRTENPNALVTDIVSVAAYLLHRTSGWHYPAGEQVGMPEAVRQVCGQTGVRFSPKVCRILPEVILNI